MVFLNIDAQNEVQIPLRALIGESIAVLGIKGSGKTNTAAVLIEELLANGLPLTVVDIEGEYWGLKEKFDIFVIGQSANIDVSVTVEQAAAFAEFSVAQGISLILDLSEFEPAATQEFLLRYFEALWRAEFSARRPYQIVLEEAHEFVPQSVRTPLKDVLTRIALRGRKRGLGIISVSQRSAKVEKDILTQAAIVFLHRVVHPIDMKVYQDILPLPSHEVEVRVAALRSGDAIVMVNNAVQTAHVRVRHTFHAGATPELEASRRPKLRNVNNTMLAELRKLAMRVNKQPPEDELKMAVTRFEAEIAKRDVQVAEQQQEIERLRLQVELLSKLELSVDSGAFLLPETARQVDGLSIGHMSTEKPGFAPSVEGNLSSSDKAITPDSRQQKRFEHLVNDLRQLPRFQRAILTFLVEREGTTFTTANLARWLHLSTSTIENRPPLELIKMGLIMRGGTRGKYTYEASARKQIRSMFPDLDAEQLIERLLQIIR